MTLLEPLREEELTTEKTHVGASAEKVGASGELGAPGSGTADGVSEAGGMRRR